MFGALGGILETVATGLGTNLLSNELIGKPNAATAWEYSKQGSQINYDRYKRRYQDTMADMRAAGLNPILAAGSGGFNVGGGPQVSAPQGYQPQNPTSAEPFSAYQSYTSAKLNEEKSLETRENVNRIIAETAKTRKEVLQVVANTYKQRAEQGLISAQEKNAIKELRNIEQRWWNLNAEFQKTMKQAYQAESQNRLNNATIKEVKSKKSQIDVMTKQLQQQLAELKRTSAVYAGPTGYIIKYVEKVVDAINLHIGLIPKF